MIPEVLTKEQVAERGENWYQSLVDECRGHIIEARTASAWTLIVAYHAVGCRIISEKQKFEGKGIYGQQIADKVAKSIGINRQYVFDAVKFAEKYPDIQMFPGDKSLTWNRVRQQYLMTAEQKEKEEKSKNCPNCGWDFKEKRVVVKQ